VVALDEWQAAAKLGGNAQVSKTTASELNDSIAGEGSFRFRSKYQDLTNSDIEAFKARQAWMADRFKEEYGSEVVVYRGVSKSFAKGLPNSGEVDLPGYSLSSWTVSRSAAAEFASGKNGRVVKAMIKPEDVWLLPRRGVESPIKVADAGDEIVVLNRTKTRRAEIV